MIVERLLHIILLNYYTNVIQWLEKHLLTCPSKKLLHIDCPGCGLQRSFVWLAKGDVVQSIQIYPATIPILILFAYLALHLIFKFKNGARNLTFLFLFCSSIIFINYIYKIVTNQIF